MIPVVEQNPSKKSEPQNNKNQQETAYSKEVALQVVYCEKNVDVVCCFGDGFF